MIKKLYYWLHKMTSKPQERGEYSAGHWQEMVRAKAVELCIDTRGKIIEVGCGEGLFLADLIKKNTFVQLYGIDIWDEILYRAKKRFSDLSIDNIELKQANATSLPYWDGFFEAVVCINVFFNLPSEEVFNAGLKEIARVCKKGGKVIFDIRNSLNPLLYVKYKLAKYYDETVKDLPLRTYSVRKITARLKNLNFGNIKVTPIGFPKCMFAPIFVIEARKR